MNFGCDITHNDVDNLHSSPYNKIAYWELFPENFSIREIGNSEKLWKAGAYILSKFNQQRNTLSVPQLKEPSLIPTCAFNKTAIAHAARWLFLRRLPLTFCRYNLNHTNQLTRKKCFTVEPPTLDTYEKRPDTRYRTHFCLSLMLYCWQPCKMNLWNTDPLYSVMRTWNCDPNRIITCSKVFRDNRQWAWSLVYYCWW